MTSPVIESLHPDCPDWRRLGPTAVDGALRAMATAQQAGVEERNRLWDKGFNRRKLFKGGLGVGVAALGSQLVTTRVAYADPATSTGTLVVIFMRGGMDGLSMLVPAADADYARLRPNIAVPSSRLIPLGRSFGLHPSMAPLQSLVDAGRLAAVPAVSTPDLSRSHFQAQDCLERGGVATGAQTGWLDRVLEMSGTGTTFRSVAAGGLMPRSLAGNNGSIPFSSLADLVISGAGSGTWANATSNAISALYTGVSDPIALQAALAIEAVGTATSLKKAAPAAAASYPAGDFASELKDLATLIKSDLGVRVACVDIGGWDMHTGIGSADRGDMHDQVAALASALAAFTTDLGSALDTTTIVAMSEFGRRVQQNASGGADHGHGGVSLVMGGGVTGGVKGSWNGLSASALDQGDVPGTNDHRDVLSEVIGKRLGLSTGALSTVFPGWSPTPMGIMA